MELSAIPSLFCLLLFWPAVFYRGSGALWTGYVRGSGAGCESGATRNVQDLHRQEGRYSLWLLM